MASLLNTGVGEVHGHLCGNFLRRVYPVGPVSPRARGPLLEERCVPLRIGPGPADPPDSLRGQNTEGRYMVHRDRQPLVLSPVSSRFQPLTTGGAELPRGPFSIALPTR